MSRFHTLTILVVLTALGAGLSLASPGGTFAIESDRGKTTKVILRLPKGGA